MSEIQKRDQDAAQKEGKHKFIYLDCKTQNIVYD